MDSLAVFDWGVFERNQIEKLAGKEEKVASIESDLEKEKNDLSQIKCVLDILNGFRETAQRRDIGKYSPGYICRDKMDSLAMPLGIVKDFGKGFYNFKPVEELRTSECPHCKEQHLLILEHYQTEDSYDGDTWRLRYLVICTVAEGKVFELSKRFADHRLI